MKVSHSPNPRMLSKAYIVLLDDVGIGFRGIEVRPYESNLAFV
jgi:hypothetical protein